MPTNPTAAIELSATVTEPARQKMVAFARKMANVTTGLDRFQWLAILACLEAISGEVAAEPAPRMVRRVVERVAEAA